MFRLSPSKHIKCKFCGEKGQSIVEESTSILTYIVFAIYLILTWEWGLKNRSPFGFYGYFAFAFLIVLPLIGGIFRIQTHSCKNCLNEVRQDSIFSSIDMEDNILDM